MRAQTQGIDLVDVFSRFRAVPAIIDSVIRLASPYVWLQDGVMHPEAVAHARAAGVKCVRMTASSASMRRGRSCTEGPDGRKLRVTIGRCAESKDQLSQNGRRPHFNMRWLATWLASVFGLTLALAAWLPAGAVSSSADGPHVHVQLLVPDAALKQGQAAKAGSTSSWSRAGMSTGSRRRCGEPPHMKWTLPAGITAGPLQFPAPKRLPLGPLMDFGYEDEVLFPSA